MRILFAADVPPDPDSGAAGTELRTIQGLRDLGHEVDEIWADGLPRRIRHGNLHYLLELPRVYRRVIGEHLVRRRYDVVHVNQAHAFLAARDHLARGRAGVLICRSHGLDDRAERVLRPWRARLGIPSRGMGRELPGRVIELLLDRHMRLATRYASGFLVSSSLDRDYLVNHHGMEERRVGLVAQAPADAFRATPPAPVSPRRMRRLFYIAGFAYFKGPHTVAAVANQLAAEGAEFELVWVCRSDEHDAVRALLTPEGRIRTRLLDWMPQDELRALYDEHGIFVYPSLFEGFGKVFLEAMARGLSVIGTPTGGMADIIQDGRNGFLVPFGDAHAIIERIRRLWDAPALAMTMSVEAHDTARQYSWNRVADETIRFYERILALPRRSAR